MNKLTEKDIDNLAAILDYYKLEERNVHSCLRFIEKAMNGNSTEKCYNS